MNKDLLLKVKEAILAEPIRFNMGSWVSITDVWAPCGTTACIAGFAVVFDKETDLHPSPGLWKETGIKLDVEDNRLPFCDGSIAKRAQTALGLSHQQAELLFFT